MTSVLAASDPFYTSGLFWGLIGAVIGLAAVVITWAFWFFGPPRRLLTYSMPVSTSLLTAHSRDFGLATSGLQVTYQGKAFSDPYVVTLSVESQSRRDISSADFDQERPIVFDLGVPIGATVGGNSPIGLPADVVSISGSTVKIKPMLIHRGRVLQLNLLTDGQPHLSCQSNLIDVSVIEQSPADVQRRRGRIQTISLVVVATALLFVTVPAAFQLYNSSKPAVAIVEPRSYTVQPAALFRVVGTARNIPEGDDLWLVVRPSGTGRWYPIERLAVHAGAWVISVNAAKGLQDLVVVMLPISDEAPFVRSEQARYPPGLDALPAGSNLMATVHIRVQ